MNPYVSDCGWTSGHSCFRYRQPATASALFHLVTFRPVKDGTK